MIPARCAEATNASPGAQAAGLVRVVRQQRKRQRRGGLTLMEILLVVAVMIAIASLATPNLIGMMETQKLRKSADLLRAEFAQTRIRAMKSQRIQMFRYQLGQGGYLAQPWVMADDELESSSTAADAVVGKAATQLPDGVTFRGGEATTDARGAAIEEQVAGDATSQIWSPPILFYPDGTSSNATVVLGNQRQQGIEVQLRGLTGLSDTSDLTRLEEP